MEKNLTIILADAHAIEREGIAAVCRGIPNCTIAGECSDGAAALQLIQSAKPVFAILDFNLPKLHSLDVIRKVREAKLPVKLIVLAASKPENMVREALRAGADGFLLKEGPARHLVDAINYIRDGGTYLSPLLGRDALVDEARGDAAHTPLGSLSPREYEVFSLLVDGRRNKEIAGLLNISPKTVDTYRSSLMRKLGIHDLVSLVKFAIQKNLTSITPESGSRELHMV